MDRHYISVSAKDTSVCIVDGTGKITREVSCCYVLKAWAMKIARHRGMKKAIVALARRLAVITHRIWTDATEFKWTRQAAAA
jgi:hypothetical protein